MDAAVGPIRVKNAEASDIIKIEIIDIKFADHGVMVTSINLGVLGDHITAPNTKIIPIEANYAIFNNKIKLPLTPMIGVIGVATKSEEIHCAKPGDHGGNMDTKEVTIGSIVYLPVFQKGAGLAISDLHACMGDGELSGTGIETAGKVKLKVTVIKGKSIKRPIIETKDSIFTIATAKTLEEGIKIASLDMVTILMKQLNLNFPDAYRLLSATCDIRISQVVNGVFTLKVRAPKSLFTNAII